MNRDPRLIASALAGSVLIVGLVVCWGLVVASCPAWKPTEARQTDSQP